MGSNSTVVQNHALRGAGPGTASVVMLEAADVQGLCVRYLTTDHSTCGLLVGLI